jgi:hypothetical protein
MEQRKKLGIVLAVTCINVAVSAAGVSLVENGRAVAEIVLPEKAIPAESFAAKELSDHVKLISGVPLNVVKSPTGAAKTVIRLGRASNLGLNGFKRNWAKVVVVEGAVDIVGVDGTGLVPSGNTACGTLFGVYEFLERELGVRWLWPGELGTYYRRSKDVSAKVGEREIHPLSFAEWRQCGDANTPGWNDRNNANRYYANERLWLRRHRFVVADGLAQGHGFTEHWEKYGKEHPEWFNMLPDGTRRPDPLEGNGRQDLITLCTSNPDTVKMVVDGWKMKNPDAPINANENDARGKCCCTGCLAADENPDPEGTLKRARTEFEARNPKWPKELGELAIRYAKFYRAVLDEGRKVRPDCRVIGQVYANYAEPPPKGSVKLDPAIVLRFCPPVMYPWTPEKVSYYKRVWSGWSDTGASIMFRPNFTLDGHSFPLMYYRSYAECMDFAWKHGVVAVDMDSLLGVYGANGLTTYVIAQKISSPEETVKEMEDDYFAAFGSSEPVMRSICRRFLEASERGYVVDDAEKDQIEGGGFADFMLRAYRVFPQEMMRTTLDELGAAIRAEKDTLVAKRLDFVRIGLVDAAMVQKTQRGFVKFKGMKKESTAGRHFEAVALTGGEGDKTEFVSSYRQLMKFRRDHEPLGYINPTRMAYLEGRHWPRYYGVAGPEAIELGGWELKLDPDKDAPVVWKLIGGVRYAPKGYDKVCWYRCRFSVDAPTKHQRFVFGGIDGLPVVYLNGEMVLEKHPVADPAMAWCATFPVDVTGKLKKGENELLVRIDKRLPGRRGIYAPVFLDTVDR